MSYGRNFLYTYMLIALFVLSACGTRVPSLNEGWEPADIDDDLAYRITKSVRCELITAVKTHGSPLYTNNSTPGIEAYYEKRLPDDWGAQLTLTLTVDEKSSLNPSGSYTRNISSEADVPAPGGSVAQSFSLPFTTQLSSQAVRTDTYYNFYTVAELIRERPIDTPCHRFNPLTGQADLPLDRSGSSYLLQGNLKIGDWLKGALKASRYIPSSKLPDKKNLEVLQYDIKFVVLTEGTVNPLWKLAPVSTGIGGLPLASTNRTRTHQMLLTFGPTEKTDGKSSPVQTAVNLHTSGQLQNAVNTGIRSALGR
ncbi:hypothetical protein [Methylorubrum thiocyanatum]|uniref:hypothetical protein n=1 Tax=Methylorubrum thiocyanatum TaxID=47958 RepID=UPI00398C2FC5